MYFLVGCNIPPVITGILSQVYKIIIIIVPIIIVVLGSIDFIKAIASKNEDNIASTGKTFITRLITGVLVFFVLTIVTWLFRVVIGNVNEASAALECTLQILGGETTYTQLGTNKEYSNCVDTCKLNTSDEISQHYCINSCNNKFSTVQVNQGTIDPLEKCYNKCNKNYDDEQSITACENKCNSDFNVNNYTDVDVTNKLNSFNSGEKKEEYYDETNNIDSATCDKSFITTSTDSATMLYSDKLADDIKDYCNLYVGTLIYNPKPFNTLSDCISNCSNQMYANVYYKSKEYDSDNETETENLKNSLQTTCKKICSGYCTDGTLDVDKLNKNRCKSSK